MIENVGHKEIIKKNVMGIESKLGIIVSEIKMKMKIGNFVMDEKLFAKLTLNE